MGSAGSRSTRVFFLATGLMKLASPRQNAAAAKALGVPAALSAAAGYLLAPIEITCGAGLIVTPAAPSAAYGALILLAIFSTVVLANLLAGRRPECGCFGSLSRATIGWPDVARNLLLMFLAGAIIARAVTSHGTCRLGCYGDAGVHGGTLMAVALAAESLVLCILASLVIRLTLQAGRVQLRLAALEASDVTRVSAVGTRQARLPGDIKTWLDRVGIGALVFITDGCGACDRLLADVAADQTLVSVPALLVAPGPVHWPLAYPFASDERGELRRALAVDAFPTAILCDARKGVIGRARGLHDVRTLLQMGPQEGIGAMRVSAVDHE